MNATLTATEEKPEFLLIFRDTDLEKRLPHDQVKESMQRFNEWMERWSKRGHLKGGQPLSSEGRVVAKAKERVVIDGPFSESKEVVGGYIIVSADNLDEATKIAEDWPQLDYGSTVEVRPILKFCPAMEVAGLEHYPLGT
jgi:hypothetical protein